MTHRVVIIAIFVAAIAVTPWMAFAASVPSVGSMAPEFTLPSQEGTAVSLKDYRGKWVVLYFYPQTSLAAARSRHTTFSATTGGTSKRCRRAWRQCARRRLHKQFCTKEGLSFKLLADTDHKVSSEYGSLTSLGLVNSLRGTPSSSIPRVR